MYNKLMKDINLTTFLRKYPNDEACLAEIFKKKYPDGAYCEICKKITAHFKLKGRFVYSCTYCRHQISPLVNTIFEKSSLSLRIWFYAIFIMVKTRSGVSAKQLERELGISYKTAHRMFKLIRRGMSNNGGDKLSGDVEIDESLFGGTGANDKFKWYGQQQHKESVMGMIERNGRAYIKHIPDTSNPTLLGEIEKNISKDARIISDKLSTYSHLSKMGYVHDSVNHTKTFVVGDVHTQNIDGMWSNIKRGIYGVYRHVSSEYLQNYIDEYTFRYNNRNHAEGMFDLLLTRVVFERSVGA